jgi:hypothetical protein
MTSPLDSSSRTPPLALVQYPALDSSSTPSVAASGGLTHGFGPR